MSGDRDHSPSHVQPDEAAQRLCDELWNAIARRRPGSPVVRPGTAERIWGRGCDARFSPPPTTGDAAGESHPLFAELSYHLQLAHAMRSLNRMTAAEFAVVKWRIFMEI